MKALVTGGAGLTGGAICRALLARGYEVSALVRRPEQRNLVPEGAAAVLGDVADAERVGELLARADVLVHVAGILLGGALARIDTIVTPRHVVAVSSSAVGARHRASAAAYRAGEDALRSVRPDAVLLRPTMIYGSRRDRNIHHAIAFARRFRFLPLIGDGSALVQPVHFEDVATAAAALIGGRAREPVEIGGAAPLSLREAARTILAAVGAKPRLLVVPYGLALGAARAAERVRRSRLAEKVERMLEDRIVDNTALRSLTGLAPRAFETGIQEQVLERS